MDRSAISIATVCLFVTLTGVSVLGQENAQTRIPQSLAECYQDANIFERDNRLPMTMNMLIELIRKAEDSPGVPNDMRAMAVSLVHRFRQDGIERAVGVFNSATVLPFSPSGFQFSKHRILLSRLLQGNANQFPNGTLTTEERCALHFMMSSSIDTRIRGDENTRCSQLSQYRTRVPRDTQSPKFNTNFLGDTEVFSKLSISEIKRRLGRMQEGAEEEIVPEEGEEVVAEEEVPEAEEGEVEGDYGNPSIDPKNDDAGLVDIASNQISQCPVENGVIQTRWGAITGGTLISGIATGLQQENVNVRDLLALSRNGELRRRGRQATLPNVVDNRWAATLAGDLAEVALLQGPLATTTTVGGPGTFNSTTIPRWYFLTQRERLELTDAEIRGGIDGLILAMNIMNWRNRFSGLRLSQVLDMYYSQRGVFGSVIHACNRQALFTEVAPLTTMIQQATAFSTVLDREMQLRVTLSASAIADFSEQAAQALSGYVPQSITTLPCGITSIIPNDESIYRISADLFIYVDISWPFGEVQPAVAHLLDNMDVNRFGTTYTLMNAMDGSVIVPRTQSLADLYMMWNLTTHQSHPQGFSLRAVYNDIHIQTTNLMNSERQNNSVSLNSKLAIIIPNMANPSDPDANFAMEMLRTFRENIPDLRIIFLSGGSPARFERFVMDHRRDLFPLRTSAINDNGIPVQVNDVIVRALQVPRRIVNPHCGGDWQSNGVGNNQANNYVEPRGVIFYRIHPNYFFRPIDNGNRRVRIQGHGYSQIIVCMSRTVENPRINATNPADINCRSVLGDSYDINLNNMCEDASMIHQCNPVFISVEGSATNVDSPLRCLDTECRFPDMARYGVHTENLGCFNSARRIFTSLFSILLPVLLVSFKFFF